MGHHSTKVTSDETNLSLRIVYDSEGMENDGVEEDEDGKVESDGRVGR